MLESKRTTIGEYQYEMTLLTAPVGRRLLVRLFKTLGPAVSAALAGLPEGKDDKIGLGDLSTRAIGDAVGMLAETISEAELDNICEILAKVTEYSPDGGNRWLPMSKGEGVDEHWAGRYLDMFKWIVFGLEVNYSDFLDAPRSLVGLVSAQGNGKGSKSKSQEKSTGTSTESPPAPDTPQA